MGCPHTYIVDSGMRVCKNCGFVERKNLDPLIYSYNESAPHPKRRYNRNDRFVRILRGLNGVENVPCEIVSQIPPCTCPQALRIFMSKRKNLKPYLPKLASVFYQLGNKYAPLSPTEIAAARRVFVGLPRCSFIITVPLVLNCIHRQDLLRFCKPLSKNMEKKYIATNEAYLKSKSVSIETLKSGSTTPFLIQ